MTESALSSRIPTRSGNNICTNPGGEVCSPFGAHGGSNDATKEAGNIVDLDSDPITLIDVVGVGKETLMMRNALTGLRRPGVSEDSCADVCDHGN